MKIMTEYDVSNPDDLISTSHGRDDFYLSLKTRISSYYGRVVPEQMFLKYGASSELDQVINDDSLIIINGINHAGSRTMKRALSSPREAKVLILVTMEPGIEYLIRNIKWFTPSGGHHQYLYYNVSDIGPTLKHYKVSSEMKPNQLTTYIKTRNREVSGFGVVSPKRESFIRDNFYRSSQVGNFYYPPVIQQAIVDSQPAPVDKIVEHGGWVDASVTPIYKYSKKFCQIVGLITMHPESKQVILTHYYDRSGALLLQSLLALYSIKSIILRNEDRHDQKSYLASIEQFNSTDTSSPKVLIATHIPMIPLFNVDQLHLVERYDKIEYNQILNILYRKIYYHDTTPISQLNVYFHVTSNKPQDKLVYADNYFFDRWHDKYQKWRSGFINAVGQSRPIVQGDSGKWMISNQSSYGSMITSYMNIILDSLDQALPSGPALTLSQYPSHVVVASVKDLPLTETLILFHQTQTVSTITLPTFIPSLH